MATLDTTSPFTLTNSFTGNGKLLAISSSDSRTLVMIDAISPEPPNAQWILRRQDLEPFYSLHTVASGTDYALDVINDQGTDSIKLHLAPKTRASGQYWFFDEVVDPPTIGGLVYHYRLSNNFTGPDMHLDVYSDTLEPHLAAGDASGQYWKQQVVLAASGGGGGAPIPTESSSTGGTGSSETETVTATPSGQVEPVLSSGAIAGVAIGGVVALALLIGVAAWIVISTRKKKRQESSDSTSVRVVDEKANIGTLPVSSPPPVYEAPGTELDRAELGSNWQQVPPVELPSDRRD